MWYFVIDLCIIKYKFRNNIYKIFLKSQIIIWVCSWGGIKMEISLKINGNDIKADVKPNTLLSTFIRENLNLTGTHIGCDTSQCGACAIHLNGDAIKSCAFLAVQADGAEITTIEGIANGDELHPMQQAFHENHGLQCGYCTPGMVMSSIKLVENKPNISDEEIRKGLEGNICRCTGYQNIVKSIKKAATVMGG